MGMADLGLVVTGGLMEFCKRNFSNLYCSFFFPRRYRIGCKDKR